jgi:D-glycero-alpha-D-manno-heptose-7-phosphate kinase
LGGKILGAGGGGFFMLYVSNHSKAKLRKVLTAEGLREMPYDFDYEGAKVLVNF